MKEINSIKNSIPDVICARDYLAVKKDWLWYPYIHSGEVSMIYKSDIPESYFFLLGVAAMLTDGVNLPMACSDERSAPINILWMSPDVKEKKIVSIFADSNGDLDRFMLLNENDKLLSLDDERIYKAIKTTNAKLLVIDPFSYYVRNSGIEDEESFEKYLNVLKGVAHETGCAIVLLESSFEDFHDDVEICDEIYEDTYDFVDSFMFLGRAEDDPEELVLIHDKSNSNIYGENIGTYFEKDKMYFHFNPECEFLDLMFEDFFY